jgi:hypothetical protein
MSTRGRLVASLPVLGCALVVVVVTAASQLVLPLSPGRLQLASAQLIERFALWRAVRAGVGQLAPTTAASATVAVVVGGLVVFVAYAAAIAVLWRRPPTRGLLWLVVGTSAVLLACAVLALPNVSTDIYDYLLTARVRTAHGDNPILVAPDAFPADPLWPFASRQYTAHPDNKLGLWVLFSLPFAVLGGDDPVRSLLVLRSALAAVGLLNVGLVVLILRRLCPRHVLAGTALFGWNPIVASHTAAKTDTLMVALFLTFLLLSLHQRARVATVAAAGAALVKLLSIPLGAVLVAGQIRASARPVREAVVQGALAVGAVLLVYQVFGRDPLLVVRHLSGANAPGWSVSPVVMAVIAVVMGLLVVGTVWRQDGTLTRFLATSVPLAVFTAAALGYVGFAWYAMVPVALLALVAEARAAAAAVVVSLVVSVHTALDNVGTGTFQPVELPRLASQGIAGALLLGALALSLSLPAVRVRWTASRT